MSDLPDEQAIRVRRSWAGEPPAADAGDDAIDEITEVSRRRGAASVASSSSESSSSTAPPTESEPDVVVRRSTYIESVDDIDDTTDGSTIVAHRESRRRAARRQERDQEPPHPHSPPRLSDHDQQGDAEVESGDTIVRGGRVETARTSAPATGEQPTRTARTPNDAGGSMYPIRDSSPVVASRAAVSASSPQVPVDGDADAARNRRVGRRTVLIAAGATAAAVFAAAATLVAIFTTL